jgi:hypothetical protein
MEFPRSVPRSEAPFTAGGLDGRCGYCGRRLASVAFIYTLAKPACGSALCLHRALMDSEQAEQIQRAA